MGLIVTISAKPMLHGQSKKDQIKANSLNLRCTRVCWDSISRCTVKVGCLLTVCWKRLNNTGISQKMRHSMRLLRHSLRNWEGTPSLRAQLMSWQQKNSKPLMMQQCWLNRKPMKHLVITIWGTKKRNKLRIMWLKPSWSRRILTYSLMQST